MYKPQWLSEEYKAYIISSKWKAKCVERKKIDNGHCRGCFTTEDLQVHHATYQRLFDEDMGDLTTLCRHCHEWVHLGILAKKGKLPSPPTYMSPVEWGDVYASLVEAAKTVAETEEPMSAVPTVSDVQQAGDQLLDMLATVPKRRSDA